MSRSPNRRKAVRRSSNPLNLLNWCGCETLECRRLLTLYAPGASIPPGPEFVPEGREWPQPGGAGTPVDLTYGYSNGLDGSLLGVTVTEIRNSIEEGLQLWTAVAPLRVVFSALGGNFGLNDLSYNTAPDRAHLLIGHHAFDGAGGTLAHGFFPPVNALELAGDLHFDVAETYGTIDTVTDFDMIFVAAHEFGHTLGLAHETSPPQAIMNPSYQAIYSGPGTAFLLADDISGMQAVYGAGLGFVQDEDGNLHVSGTEGANTFTVTNAGGNLSVSSTGFGSFSIPLAGITSVIINGRGGNDTFNLDSLPGVPLTINAAAGNDVFNIGGGDLDSNISANVTVNGGAGNDDLNFDDTADGSGSDTYTVTTSIFTKFTRTFTYSAMEGIDVDGSPQASTYTINALANNAPLKIVAGALSDVFNVGGGDLDTVVLGSAQLVIDGGDGANSIVIDDTADTAGGDEYDIQTNSLTKPLITLNALSFNNISNFTINGSPQISAYNIHGTPAGMTLTLNGGSLDDTFNITPLHTFTMDFEKLRRVDSVSVDQGANYSEDGFNLLDVGGGFGLVADGINSFRFTGSTTLYQNTSNGVTRLTQKDGNPFTMLSVALAELNGNQATPADITFTGTLVGGGTVNQTFTLDGVAFGAETFNFNASFTNIIQLDWTQVGPFHQFDNFVITAGQRVNAMDGPVVINGNDPASSDTLDYDDTANPAATTYTVTNTSIASSVGATVTYGTVESVLLDAGSGVSTIALNTSNGSVAITANGNGGADIFNIDPSGHTGIATNGAITINGGAATDAINVNDTVFLFPSSVGISSTFFSRSFAPSYTYATAESLVWNGGPGAETYSLISTLATTPVTVNGGLADDRFDVGGTFAPFNLDGILGTLRINGEAGALDSIIANDDNNAGAVTWAVTNTTFNRTGTALITYATVESLTIDGGTNVDTFNIDSTASLTPVTVNGNGGADIFNVGTPSNFLDSLDATLAVNGNAAIDTLNYNDQANGINGDQYALSATVLSRDFSAAVTYGTMEAVVVNGGTGGTTFNVDSTAAGAPMTVNGGAGDDAFNVGNGDWDLNLAAPVTISGGANSDSITINDTADAGNDNYSVNGGASSKTGGQVITYNTLESYVLQANGDINAITVNSTFPGTALIRAGAGADTISVIDNAAAQFVDIDTGPALDRVVVNTGGVGTARVQFSSSQDLFSLGIADGGTLRVNSGGNKVLYTQDLATDVGGVLDMTDEDMIIDYAGASPVGTIRDLLATGYAGNAWNGFGINSSTAAADLTKATALGYGEAADVFAAFPATFSGVTVDNTAVLVKYTYYGDGSLDGQVDITDLGMLASNWQLAPRRWSFGNFNYDGLDIVDISDLGLLATNWQAGVGSPLRPTIDQSIRQLVNKKLINSRRASAITDALDMLGTGKIKLSGMQEVLT